MEEEEPARTEDEDLFNQSKRLCSVSRDQELPSMNHSTDEDGNICHICLDIWDSHGSHQICSLSCGHFFGLSCIKRVLKEQGKKSRRCPICNTQAKESDVRLHYAVQSLVVKDATVEENLKTQIAQERSERIAAEMNLGRATIRIKSLEMELRQLKASLLQKSPANNMNVTITFNMNRSRSALWISDDIGAVVSAFIADSNKYKLSRIHPDFPKRQLFHDTSDGHNLPIRDIALLSDSSISNGGLLASASLDSSIQLFSVQNLNKLETFQLSEPVWSVNFVKDNLLLAGTAKGTLFSLDPRFPKEPTARLFTGNEPIHSICSIDCESAYIASFTKIHQVSLNQLYDSLSVIGLTGRSPGSQYTCMVKACNSNAIAISVRGQIDRFVETGYFNKEHFSLKNKYGDGSFIPSGRLGCFDDQNILVPDELNKTCLVYPSKSILGTVGERLINMASYCGNSNSYMLVSADNVDFFR